MSFLKRYTEHHLIELDLSKTEAINTLKDIIRRKESRQGLLTKELLSGERLELSEDTLVIHRKKAFFDSFRGHGTITMSFSEKENGKTEINYHLVPFGENIETGMYLLAFLLGLWTVVSLAISLSFYTVLTIVIGWLMMAFIAHFALTWNKNQLNDYAVSFIQKTFRSRTKSNA